MDTEVLRREAADAFAALGAPEQLTLDTLAERIEQHRGRKIVVRPVARLGGDKISGLWLSLPSAELVLHAETSSELHREQIILHELAHMVLQHDLLVGEDQHVSSLLPDLDRSLVARVLARCRRQSEPEIVAESLADLFAGAISRARRARRAEPLNFRGVFG
jgi:hypothetical protein